MNNRAGDLRVLLQRLGPRPDEAAGEYEQLRRRMIKFFTWEQCTGAEDLADECLDRVARKLEEGVVIQSLSGYLGGVARLLLKEYQAKRRREQAVLTEFAFRREAESRARELERAVVDLGHCLDRFLPEQRRLILRYYEGDHGLRIENRRRLAEELELLPNALRNRAMRLRSLLENCMQERAHERDGSPVRTTVREGGG